MSCSYVEWKYVDITKEGGIELVQGMISPEVIFAAYWVGVQVFNVSMNKG